MLKKLATLVMLYSAVAIMLGHEFFPHHHHFDFNEKPHHHHAGNHHHNDSENEDTDWSHLFSNFQHAVTGLTFLTSHCATNNFSKPIQNFTTTHTTYLSFQCVIIELRQNTTPYFADYYNSQISLSSGLRAPPNSII
jgi:hypothetical protein